MGQYLDDLAAWDRFTINDFIEMRAEVERLAAALTDEERLFVESIRRVWSHATDDERRHASQVHLLAIIDRLAPPPGEPDEADKIAGGGGGSRKSSDPLPCRTCGGKGCEYGCGQCDHFPTTHGPNAHRQCVSCLGSGIEPDGEPDEGEGER